MEKNVIFSTQGLYKKKDLIVPIIIYIILCVCFFLCFYLAIKTWIGIIVAAVFVTIFALPLIKTIHLMRSYVVLSEDKIYGHSIPKQFLVTTDDCDFSLKYSDVTNVATKKNIVEIYFSGGSYQVQAKAVEQKVVELINKLKDNELNIKDAE